MLHSYRGASLGVVSACLARLWQSIPALVVFCLPLQQALSASTAATAAPPPGRPNVLWIVMDELA